MNRDVELEEFYFHVRSALGAVVARIVEDIQPLLEEHGAADVFQLIADVFVGDDGTTAHELGEDHPDRPPIGEFAGYIETAAAMPIVTLVLGGLGIPVELKWTPGTDLQGGSPVWTGIWTVTRVDADEAQA